MANTRLFWRDKWAAATTTASSEAYQLGVENLSTHHLAEPWQTTGASASEWAKANLGSAMSIQAFAFLSHNFDNSEAGLTIMGDAAANWLSPDFSQAVTYRTPHFIEFFSALQSEQWWLFKFTKALAADLRSGGRIMLGPYYEFTRNPAHDGLTFTNTDTSKTRKNKSGQLHSDIGVTLRGLQIELPACGTAQADELIELKDTMGTHSPFIVSIDHASEPIDWMIYGNLTKLSDKKHRHKNGSDHLWDFKLEMESVK